MRTQLGNVWKKVEETGLLHFMSEGMKEGVPEILKLEKPTLQGGPTAKAGSASKVAAGKRPAEAEAQAKAEDDEGSGAGAAAGREPKRPRAAGGTPSKSNGNF